MALDEPKENDHTMTDRGITYLIEKDLLEKTRPIRIDFVESADGAGFKLTSSLPSCGGSCC